MFSVDNFVYFTPEEVENAPYFNQETPRESERKEFVLGEHTATRLDLMKAQIQQNGLWRYGISPVDYMRFADMVTRGKEGAHIFYHQDRVFTAIVRGYGKVNNAIFGVVRTIRRGFPSKNITLPVIDHREFAPTSPYSSVRD